MLVEKAVRDFRMLLDTEDSGMSTQLQGGINWEGEAPDILDRLIQPEWTVIEMGACLGFYMLLEAKKAKKVYAVEADPHNCEIMSEAVKLNGLDNVEVFNLAVAEKNGIVKFLQSPGRSDRGRILEAGNIEVKSTTLDSFVKEQGIEQVDLIRCDIEGAEVHMVSGGLNTLRAMPVGSWMFIDLHPRKFTNEGRWQLTEAIKTILRVGFVPKTILGRCGKGNFVTEMVNNPGFPKVFFEKCQ